MLDNIRDFMESLIIELKNRFDVISEYSTIQDSERREMDCLMDAFSAPLSSLSLDYLTFIYFEKSDNLIPPS